MDSSLKALGQRLRRAAMQHWQKSREPINYAGHEQADQLIADLQQYPHAFVLAALVDRQVKSQVAWMLPWELKNRLGTFDFGTLASLSLARLKHILRHPKPLHRFPARMAGVLCAAIRRIATNYRGYAANIWNDRPSSAALVLRFYEFQGAGPKIATMAANLLVRDFRIPLSDYSSLDVSVDVHVRRVFYRLGFIPRDADRYYVVLRARELSPEYPGVFDKILWDLGRTVCRPRRPRCSQCPWVSDCRFAQQRR